MSTGNWSTPKRKVRTAPLTNHPQFLFQSILLARRLNRLIDHLWPGFTNGSPYGFLREYLNVPSGSFSTVAPVKTLTYCRQLADQRGGGTEMYLGSSRIAQSQPVKEPAFLARSFRSIVSKNHGFFWIVFCPSIFVQALIELA
jgi:hypothetical protein